MMQLLADDGAPLDWFGQAVAADGDVIAVGAPGNNSVYVYRFVDNTWQLEDHLWGSGQFGKAVALTGNTLVVGAFTNGVNGPSAGAAYVFRFDGSQWVEEALLLASDGESGDYFGAAVDVSGNRIIVGAWNDEDPYNWELGKGAAYIFRYSGASWYQEAKLIASDGEPADWFGVAVGISGYTAVVGAHGHDANGQQAGAAYTFRFLGSYWTQEQKLVGGDTMASDLFGEAVDIGGNVIVIGARGDDDLGSKSGAAYVFRRPSSVWIQEAKLLPSDGAALDEFGVAVALDGDVIAVGSHLDDDNGTASGSAYLFGRNDYQEWSQQSKLLPTDGGGVAEYFGNAVALSADTCVVGSFRDKDQGSDSGSASAYVGACACVGDITADGLVDGADLSELLGAWGAAAGHPADIDGDGFIDGLDLALLLGTWGPCE